MNRIERVVLIGSGNVAEALARTIGRCTEVQLVQLFARNPERGHQVAEIGQTTWTDDPQQLAAADLYLLAVSDRAVAEVAVSLPIPPTAVIAHTAGSVPLDALPAKFARRAVFYPLQTFTRGRKVDFREIPIFLETTDDTLCSPLEHFARQLSEQVIFANSEQRKRLHLAAVFACNFANHMYALGERIVGDTGLDFALLKPLIAETARKACDAISPITVQTGPAARNDRTTQERHTAMLAEEPLLEELYRKISQNIWEISKKI